jgi:hypothetical protein
MARMQVSATRIRIIVPRIRMRISARSYAFKRAKTLPLGKKILIQNGVGRGNPKTPSKKSRL